MEDLLSELSPYVSDAAKASAGAVLLGLLRPVRDLFDKQQRRANARRDLETLKTMVEIEAALASHQSERLSAYQQQYEIVLGKHKEFRQLRGDAIADSSPYHSPFNYVDVIAALFAPIVTALLLLADAANDTETGEILLFVGSACVFSLLIARCLVYPFIRSGVAQTLLQVLGSIIAMILGFMVMMILLDPV